LKGWRGFLSRTRYVVPRGSERCVVFVQLLCDNKLF